MRTTSAMLAMLALIGCSAATRHKTLTRFFDGVPPLDASTAPGPKLTATTIGTPSAPVPGEQHGPYAARLCNACHAPGAANALLAPRDELCLRCHTLDVDKAYVHGPLASGGCLVCHDPHSSRYDHLLVADPATFCTKCHDRELVATIEGHADLAANCTACHDAHGSDAKYLLK